MRHPLSEEMRRLRERKGIGIRRAARELGVSHTYLSKIENSKATPSEDFLERAASYYEGDRDALMLAADRIPLDIRRILQNNPREALDYLRQQFGVVRDD